jgi:hypothetical protein
MGFMVNEVAFGQVFSEYCGFRCQAFYRLLQTHHHPPSWAGTVGQMLADVPSGLRLTPPQETSIFTVLIEL